MATAIFEARSGRGCAGWTDRRGGTSHGRYESCNVGDHVGDGDDRVRANRALVLEGLGFSGHAWCGLRQVHGASVAMVSTTPDDEPVADAVVTRTPGLALAVVTADCAPIALLAPDAVGVVHAGWPGLRDGVITAAISALRELTDHAITAFLGPCIHPSRYEFGAADLAALQDRLGPHVVAQTRGGRPAFDVPGAVRHEVEQAGVAEFVDVGICTAADARCFSHRRDGVTGRQALVAALL